MQAKNGKKKVYLILGLVMGLMLLLEIRFAHPHHHRLWNVVPGADILLGFGGAWLLIFLGKIVMNRLLRRPENYYMTEAESLGTEGTAAVAVTGRQGAAADKTFNSVINGQKAGGTHE